MNIQDLLSNVRRHLINDESSHNHNCSPLLPEELSKLTELLFGAAIPEFPRIAGVLMSHWLSSGKVTNSERNAFCEFILFLDGDLSPELRRELAAHLSIVQIGIICDWLNCVSKWPEIRHVPELASALVFWSTIRQERA